MKKLLSTVFAILLVATTACAQQRQAPAIGTDAPEIALPDASGKTVTLSSMKGKWVVIDFWGSWCGWCIKGFPEMKASYSKLQSKAIFLGVACGDSAEAWKAALKKHELPWVNVWNDPKGDNKLMEDYGIQGFPTKVIVDPKGKIRNITVGEDPAFYTTLYTLIK